MTTPSAFDPDLALFTISSQLSLPKKPPMYIDTANNKAGEAASFAEAWKSGRSFAVMMRPEVIPIDFDKAELARYPEALQLVRQSASAYLELRSGRPGHRHLLIYEPEPAKRHGLEEDLRSLLGNLAVRTGQYVRPPGAPHRMSGRSMPIDWRQVADLSAPVMPSSAVIASRLLPSTQRLLSEGREKGYRSEWDHKVIWRLVLEGLTDAEIVQLALTSGFPFSEKAREIRARSGANAALNYLLQSLAKIRPKVVDPVRRIRSREDADAYLGSIAAVIDTTPPDRFGSLTTRKVMAGCVRLFQQQHTLSRPLSVRDVAMQAGVHRSTASQHLKRLAETGWLVLLSGADGALAAEYRLETSKLRTLLQATGGLASRSVLPFGDPGHMAYRHGFLNESGRSVLNAMPEGQEIRRKDLLESTGLKESTLDNALTRLMDWGTIERTGRGRYRRLPADLDELSELHGADLVEHRQHRRIEQERARFGGWQLRLSWQNMLLDWEPIDSHKAVNRFTGEVRPIKQLLAEAAGRSVA